jgi:RND family efflux transporter MFP subunit
VAAAAALLSVAADAAEFDCMIEPRRVVALASPVQAPITNIRVDRGDIVNRGDVVVEFEAEVERAAAELAKFRSEMTGTIEARRARSEYTSAKFVRRQELVQQKFVSIQDLDETEADRRLAQAELKEAMDSRRLAELEHRRALAVTKLRTLASPVSGVVVERMMHPGEVADIGAKPILKIAEIDTLFVEVVLPLAAFGRIAKGMPVQVRPEQPIGGSHTAKVLVVDRVLDAASATFGVRLELPNAQRRIPAGVRCRAEFPEVEARKAGP